MPENQESEPVKNFIQKHQNKILAITCGAAVVLISVYAAKKGAALVTNHYELRMNYESLQEGVIAGHEFKYEPDTGALWDLAINPHKK